MIEKKRVGAELCYRGISNEAGPCQEFFFIFLNLLSFSFPSSDTPTPWRKSALFSDRSICSRRSLIRVTLLAQSRVASSLGVAHQPSLRSFGTMMKYSISLRFTIHGGG